jgi:hypothetical protein
MSNLLLQRMKEQLEEKYIHEFQLMDFKIENEELKEDRYKTLFKLKDNFFFGDILRRFGDLTKLQNKENKNEVIFDLIDAVGEFVKQAFTFEDFVKSINENMSELFISTISQLNEEEQRKYLFKEYENLVKADLTSEWTQKVINKIQTQSEVKSKETDIKKLIK